jgi:cell wall-associated NlpC family hydrolase
MIRKSVKIVAYTMTAAMLFSGNFLTANAAGLSSVLPGGGVNISLVEGPTTEELLASGGGTVSMIEALLDKAAVEQAKREAGEAEADLLASEDEQLKSLVIAQVNDYVNVRSIPSEEGDIVGKLYNKSVGTYLAEENGWYQITSGSVTGYVKAEYCITGEDAIALAKEVSTRIATVNTQTLKVRKDPSLDAEVLGLVPMGDVLVVSEEIEDWVKVDVEEGIGWVSTEFVDLSREFVQAESKEEEAKRLAKEAQERNAAREAAAAKAAKNAKTNTSNSASAPIPVIPSSDSAMGSAVAQYAVQFVGNPYVYGGTSLTNGADCSGFVMSVYSNFGVSLPHSSAADRKQGYAVDGLANAQPGDLICYSGHVAMYVGDGQIVHASTKKTGIIVSNADYKKILAIRRIF